jgi:hypothetical protein
VQIQGYIIKVHPPGYTASHSRRNYFHSVMASVQKHIIFLSCFVCEPGSIKSFCRALTGHEWTEVQFLWACTQCSDGMSSCRL